MQKILTFDRFMQFYTILEMSIFALRIYEIRKIYASCFITHVWPEPDKLDSMHESLVAN